MLNGKVPCGCESRKRIMFTEGDAGITELVIVGVAFTAIIIAWRLGKA